MFLTMILVAILTSYKLMTIIFIADIASDVGQSFLNITMNYPERFPNISGEVSLFFFDDDIGGRTNRADLNRRHDHP